MASSTQPVVASGPLSERELRLIAASALVNPHAVAVLASLGRG